MEEEKKNLSNSEDIFQRLSNLPTSDEIQKRYEEEERLKKEAESRQVSFGDVALPAAGAGAGAYASFKGFGENTARGLFKPGENVFAGKAVPPMQPPPPTPTVNAPPTGPVTESEIQQMMQSMRSQDELTGRQKENAQHWESNRQSLATKENLENPKAKRVIVTEGPYTPLRSGIGVRQSTAVQLEEDRLKKLAHEKVLQKRAEEQALHEAHLKQQAEMAERKAAHEAEEKAAARAGLRSGLLKVGLGGLGGAFAAKDLYESGRDMYENGPNEENITKMVGGVGGGLMAIPTPLTEIAGGALLGGATAYPYIKKYLTNSDSR
jgi:hypothetical protein